MLWAKIDAGFRHACSLTASAADAAVGGTKHLFFKALSLGIVAPLAAEGTALQKDGAADAGPVEGGKFFDGKYSSCHGGPPFCRYYCQYKK